LVIATADTFISLSIILTHVGAGSDHHVAKKEIITNLSKEVIRTGQLKEANSKEDIGCTIASRSGQFGLLHPMSSFELASFN
jgi:LytS/YehU family sensor histidine kinase